MKPERTDRVKGADKDTEKFGHEFITIFMSGRLLQSSCTRYEG
jgi:hypothetical protein